MINTNDLSGKWHQIQGKLKQKYAQLTDNDLMLAEGKIEETLGLLQIKLGISKDELESLVSDLATNEEMEHN